jgi:hypothetical protein
VCVECRSSSWDISLDTCTHGSCALCCDCTAIAQAKLAEVLLLAPRVILHAADVDACFLLCVFMFVYARC